MNEIYIENVQEKFKVDENICNLLKKCCNAALEYENFKKDCEISITLCDNEYIHQLNLEYRNVDRATDVLSFPINEKGQAFEINPENGCVILGDIVLSLERAEEQANEFNHSFEREVGFLTVHSMLHLLFYDHEISKEDEIDMFRRQEEILIKINLLR